MEKKTFIEHLMESDKEYNFRIKSIVEIDAEKLSIIENILDKYELRDITSPKKTPIQDNPLDFSGITNKEVWIVDAVTGVPISSYILQQELWQALKIAEKFIVVRTDNEPLELESERIKAINSLNDEAAKKGLKTASMLSTDSVYPEDENSIPGEQLFGNEYNSKFLQDLAIVSANRKPENYDPKTKMFNWLDVEGKDMENKDSGDFNKDIKDAPKPRPWWEVKGKKVPANELADLTGPDGNFDDDKAIYRKLFADEKGKVTTLSKDTAAIRKGKK